jgi:hypothetical protein
MVKWRYSDEKEQLKKDILSGIVDNRTNPAAVYQMHDGAYHKFPYDRFKPNLKNLIQAIDKLKNASAEGDVAFASSIQEWPQEQLLPDAYPPWHNSRAKELLLVDLASGVIDGFQPLQAWQSRPEYMTYPLKTFRDHLYKEKNKPIIKAYWEHRKALT